MNPINWPKELAAISIDDMSNGDVAATTANNGNPAHHSGPNPRHLEMSNVLWCDGHVKALRVEKFYNPAVGSNSNCLRLDQSVAANECK